MVRVVEADVRMNTVIINIPIDFLNPCLRQHGALQIGNVWNKCWVTKRVSLEIFYVSISS